MRNPSTRTPAAKASAPRLAQHPRNGAPPSGVLKAAEPVVSRLSRPWARVAIAAREPHPSSLAGYGSFHDECARTAIREAEVLPTDVAFTPNNSRILERLEPWPALQARCADDLQTAAAVFARCYGLSSVCAKLQTLQAQACPRLHVDDVRMRALCTYLGPGTDYAPACSGLVFRNRVLYVHEGKLSQAGTGDLLFLKGTRDSWLAPAAAHRSPRQETGVRCLLIVDDAVESMRFFLGTS